MRWRRRIVRGTVVLTVVVFVVAAVLVAASQVRATLGALDPAWADLYLILGVLLTIAQGRLVFLARVGRLVEVRHWVWLLLPIHVVWGSGLLVGIREAVPIGIGLGMLDVMQIMWMRDVDILNGRD